MTTDLALEYIPRRMKELGYGDNYSLRFAHFVLQANQTVNVDASCQFFILVEEPANMDIESDNGIFNLALASTNEMQYEHQGQIILTNLVGAINNVRFIQVIPKNIR
jgi:hypothetical protein